MITILTTGDFSPQRVQTRRDVTSRLVIAEVEQLIDQEWTAALAKPGIKLFDGPMCRLESWTITNGSFELTISETSYKIFHGTNLKHPELADRFDPAVLANPVGLSAVLCSADGYLLFGRRNSSVAYYPNRIHPFAGCLEPRDAGDIFAAMTRELHEELNLAATDLSDLRCIGMIEDPALRQPELIFRVTARLSKSEVEARLDRAEHNSLWAVPAKQMRASPQIAYAELTPVCVGALRLWAMS